MRFKRFRRTKKKGEWYNGKSSERMEPIQGGLILIQNAITFLLHSKYFLHSEFLYFFQKYLTRRIIFYLVSRGFLQNADLRATKYQKHGNFTFLNNLIKLLHFCARSKSEEWEAKKVKDAWNCCVKFGPPCFLAYWQWMGPIVVLLAIISRSANTSKC